MRRYIALLRGINVGGHAKIAMADLRSLLADLGYADVTTYLQSGNALLNAENNDPDAVAGEIERAIAERLGLRVRVLVRTPEELAAIVANNPFPEVEATPTQLHVAFLSGPVDLEKLAEIDMSRFAPDEMRPGDRVLYIHFPNGAGRSKLNDGVIVRNLGVTATARNWNTVAKLLEMAGR